MIMCIGPGRVQLYGLQKGRFRFFVVLLGQIDCPQLQVGKTIIRIDLNGLLQQRQRYFGVIVLPFNVPQKSQSLLVVRIERQFLRKFLLRFRVLLRFPINLTQREMDVRLFRRDPDSRFIFSDCLLSLSEPVERLRHQNVGRS